MLSRSLRLVILQLAALAVLLLIQPPPIIANDTYHFGIGSGPSMLVSKDPRFGTGIQFGYQIAGTAEKTSTNGAFSAGAQIGYRAYGDSSPVSGVIYRGFKGVSLGIRAVRFIPLSSEWIDAFAEVALHANYSTYQLTQLKFFHPSAGIRPGLSIEPMPRWDWLVLQLSLPIMWEPRRGTPIGISGGISLAAVYRYRPAEKKE